MKITAVNGSPKGKKSITYLMIEEFLKGAKDMGAETQHILLSEMNIHHCIGCFSCWTKTPGICVFDDDMKKIEKNDSDILIFASPLYVDNVSGLMKNFMDRSIVSACPFIEKDITGEAVHVKKDKKIPKIIAISNCGFPEQGQFVVLKSLFKRIARNMQTELIAEIYRGQGPLLASNDKRLEGIVDNYKKLLQRAGKEISKDLKLTEDTKNKLEEPLIPDEIYLLNVNNYFKSCLKQNGKDI